MKTYKNIFSIFFSFEVPWHQTTNDRNDLKHLTDKYNHDLMAASHRQMPQPPLPHDFNSLRGSMSSSTSSIQNNMVIIRNLNL